MNHIDIFEQVTADMTLAYEIRSMIRNLHNMPMNEMLQARELMNRFVDQKENDYMYIFTNQNQEVK